MKITQFLQYYNTVQINNERIMPRGIVFAGLIVSSVLDDTASKPINAKNTVAAAANTPENPNGITGDKFAGLT